MCHYMELEYSCSTKGHPHRLRTTGLIQCDDYIGCMLEKLDLKKPGRETQQANQETEQYIVYEIGGDYSSLHWNNPIETGYRLRLERN